MVGVWVGTADGTKVGARVGTADGGSVLREVSCMTGFSAHALSAHAFDRADEGDGDEMLHSSILKFFTRVPPMRFFNGREP